MSQPLLTDTGRARTGGDDLRLTVMVADDHELVRSGFRLVLGRAEWVRECLVVSSAGEARRVARRAQPDVALVDAALAQPPVCDIVGDLRDISAGTKVLIVGAAEAGCVPGVAGVLPKSWPVAAMIESIRQVGLEGPLPDVEQFAGAAGLSTREREVLEHVAWGETNREIGARLHLSPDTVKDHTRSVYRKLGVRNRAQAVRRGVHLGLLA